jgi:DENN (AEX-3) domain
MHAGICLTSFIKCYANLKEDQAPSKAPLTPGPGLTPSIPHRRKSKVGRMSPLPEDETPAPASPLPTAEDTGPAGAEWWNQGVEGNGGLELGDSDGGGDVASGCKSQWTAVTLCFLSRWPHVQQLQQCLHYLYGTCILSSLERWEVHCDQLIANHRESIMANSHLSEGRSGSASCLVLEPVRLGMQCVDLLTMLCLESPVPLWGVFTLNIVLPALAQSNNTHTPLMDKQNVSPSKATAEAGSKGAIVRFAQCPPEDLPLCPYSLGDSIFRCLGPRGVLTVLSAALAESRILFFSSDASLLPAVCESLRTLLYPMKWAHVYLPVVPAPLLDLVQAPVPYILGTLSKWMALIPPEFLCDVVLVDLDTGAVDAMRSKEGLGSPSAALTDMVPSFPPKIERWLLCALKEVVAPNADLTEFALPTFSSMPSDGSVPTPSKVKEKDTMIQLIVFDVMANLLRYVPGCIFSLNVGESEGPSHHVFNRPLFLSDCIEDDNRPFLTMLTDTNAFEQFTESLYSPSMGFYLRSLSSLPTPVMSFKNRETPLLVPTGIHRKNSKQTHRDVLPLPGNDGKATVVDKSSAEFSFPNSVINGGDRLNVVKLPTVSVTPEAVIVTAPSSPSVSPCSSRRNSINSIKGMLLFPTSTSAAQQPDNSMCLDLCLARTGSCDSILTRSTDSLTGGSSSRAAGSVSKDRSDKGRLLSLFPDWIVALMANHSDASCPSNVTKRTFIEPVIDFYAPLVMCSREQRSRDDFVSTGTGMIYEGYQPGNVIETQSSLQGLNPFPVLTLTVSPSKIRETRTSLIEQETTASIFSVDSEDWDSSRTSSKSPRLKALRSGSELERELSTDESKSILRGGEARGMVPLSSTRSGSSESRPMSLNLSKTKRTRPFSVNIRPASVNLSARTSTGDSMNAMSPSYLSFLPLIGKTSGLAVFSEGGMALEGESDNSTPTSPNRSLSSPRPADLDVSTSPLSLAFQLENEAVMRRRSYGRIRSGTFGQYSSRKGGSKHARRRHSADSCFNYPFASSAAAATSSDYMREVFSTTSDAQQPEGQSDFGGSVPVNLAEARMDTMSSIATISSFNLDPLTNPTLHHPGKDGSEKVPSPVSMCLCPPLIFDTESLEMAVGQIEEWTVGELAGALKQPIKSFLKNLKGEAERSTDPFSPWTSNNSATPPAESARSSVNARSPSRRWPNRAAVGIGGAITDYLQFAFSGVSMSPRQVEHLERRCVGALELHDNRMRLVHLLRQTNKGTPSMPPNSPAIVRQGLQLLTHPHSRAADLESQLFPLHSSTFELLSKLYSLAVEACVTHRDYLAAYGLLGVGGLYFQIQSRSKREQSRERHDEDGEYDVARETEFLCERISQHPIFQSPYLWMTVMRSKLSAYQRGPSTSPSVSSPTAKKEEIKSDPDGVECDVDALFLEAYALLFIINRLGVNYERAAAFNKMVVSDYSLAKGHYLQLQQYTDELYSPQVSCLNQVNRQYSREAAGFRSRSRSDTPQVLRLAHPQKLKLKARNFSPLSQREGTLIFHKESSMCWDGEGEGSADPGPRPVGPLSATDEGTCAVLADLTTLLPCAPPACADSGGSTTPPLSWSASMRTSISPTNASKERSHSTPFLRSLIRPAKEPVEVAVSCIKGHGYAPHPRSEEQTRGRNRGKRTTAEIKAPPSETISPKRKASVIATRLKNYFMRKVSATTIDGSKDGDAGEGEKDSSPSTAPKASSGSRSQDDRNSVSTLLPHSNTPEKSKGMKCIELNQQNYYSIPLEVRTAHNYLHSLSTSSCTATPSYLCFLRFVDPIVSTVRILSSFFV